MTSVRGYRSGQKTRPPVARHRRAVTIQRRPPARSRPASRRRIPLPVALLPVLALPALAWPMPLTVLPIPAAVASPAAQPATPATSAPTTAGDSAAAAPPVALQVPPGAAPAWQTFLPRTGTPAVSTPGAVTPAAPAGAAPLSPKANTRREALASESGWRLPLPGQPDVVRGFDPPDVPWASGHRGVDLAALPGTPVLAAGPGVVSYAAVLAGRGVVAIRHGGGLRTTYEPLVVTTAVGRRVAAGEVVGTLLAGHPGCPLMACLHWGLLRGDHYLDPLALVRSTPVRLLPLASGARDPRFRPP